MNPLALISLDRLQKIFQLLCEVYHPLFLWVGNPFSLDLQNIKGESQPLHLIQHFLLPLVRHLPVARLMALDARLLYCGQGVAL